MCVRDVHRQHNDSLTHLALRFSKEGYAGQYKVEWPSILHNLQCRVNTLFELFALTPPKIAPAAAGAIVGATRVVAKLRDGARVELDGLVLGFLGYC